VALEIEGGHRRGTVASARVNRSDRDLLFPLLAALATLLGSIGPWVAFHRFQLQAFDTDRHIVSAAAGVAGVLGFLAGQRGTPPPRLGLAACGAVALGFSARRFVQIATNDQGASLSWGLWLSVAGGLALLSTAALQARDA
jgi:peptidoglycan/LPS O-acetylase OafA/YrhL